jgi:pyruvate/2-oxoglutarate dehydrogenase complex dihydrolipoamide dehydrogenase (E3) component
MGMTGRPLTVVVIGGGPAGVTAALRAAELGAQVTLVERGRLGGTCTNDGCAPTRVLARAARLLRDVRSLDDLGISGAEPRIDLRALLGAADAAVSRLHDKKRLAEHLVDEGVRVIEGAGSASFRSPTTIVLDDGTELTADRFIIACGGHARRPGFPGAEHVLTHHDVWRMERLPGSLVIIGAAATGTQLASVFAAFGSRVTLLDLAPRILPLEDADVSEAIASAFRAHGIGIVTGIAGVGSVETLAGQDGARGRLRLRYRVADREESLEVDEVIAAAGWPGNVEGLGLDAAGVATERGSILVDDQLRTSAPGILAAGDITGRMMLVQSAILEGRRAAEMVLSDSAPDAIHSIVAHGGFTDPEYGSVGLTEGAARLEETDIVVGKVPYADLDRAVIDDRTEGFCKLVVCGRDQRILGAHVVGEQAVEVIQIAAAAMAGGVDAQRLAEVEFAYPTFTSIVGLAARQVVHALRLPVHERRAWDELGRPRVSEWEQRVER